MKKIIACLLTLGIIMGMSLPVLAETATDTTTETTGVPDNEGISVSEENYYKMESKLDSIPLTYEATVYLPEEQTEYAGVIYGNLYDIGVNILVQANGVPRIDFNYYQDDGTEKIWSRTFPKADIRTGTWAHLAIVYDPTEHSLTCYIDGVQADKRSNQTPGKESDGYVFEPQSALFIGKDNRMAHNYSQEQYFKGKIRNVAMYTDIRTAEEVAADAISVDTTDENIICYYDFDGMYNKRVEDSTANNRDLYCPPVPDTAIDPTLGVAISEDNYYSMSNIIESTPITLEATVYLPTTFADETRGGIIVGNFKDSYSEAKVEKGNYHDYMGFEIHTYGRPRLNISYMDENGENVYKDYVFKKVDVRTGNWAHIAIAYDAENATLTCYLDGVAKQTITDVVDLSYPLTAAFRIGNDYRKDTNWTPIYFGGIIRTVSLFSDMRSAEEISKDAAAVDTDDANILCHYNFDGMYNKRVQDKTVNDNDLYCPPVPETCISDSDGVYLSEENHYSMTNLIENTPMTLEATVFVPTAVSDRAGIIMGNFRDALTEAKVNAGKFRDFMNFEIHKSGRPRLNISYINDDGEYIIKDYIFSNVDVRTGGWAHLAITYDAENATLTCYLNGVAKETKTDIVDLSYALDTAFIVGCDYRNETNWAPVYFDGKVRTLSLYSDMRTADEIASDYENGTVLDDPNLLADYNFDGQYMTDTADNSSNENTLKNICIFFSENKLDDYAYSFAIIGDTQTLTYKYPEQLHNIYDFILDNKDKKKIAHVFGLGDITDRNTDEEWALAKEQIGRLDGVVDYSMVRGNHDGTAKFNATFGPDSGSAYTNQYEGYCEEIGTGINNTYRFFTVGDIDYLVLNLDYGAADVVLEWADKIIAAHPNHNVIINTHAYLTTDGTTLDANDKTTPTNAGYENNGETMWQKVFSKHSNVVMVLSGHITSDYIVMTQATGENGNKVSQFLIDPQGLDGRNGDDGLGMVAMLYFSEDGRNVQVEYYSTIKQKYYLKENTFTFTMDKVDPRYGDVNDDADVNILDFIRLKKVLAKMDVKYNTRTADCNIDKTINVYDLTDLRKKLFGLAS